MSGLAVVCPVPCGVAGLVVWYRNRLQKERDRDVSEKIALGLPNTGAARDDVQFDQRLFNQSRVSDSPCVRVRVSNYIYLYSKLKNVFFCVI